MPEPPGRPISEGRKTLYYIGLGLIAFGFLLFASTFVSACIHVGDFRDFEGQTKSMMGRALGGMFLIVVGGVLSIVGARGLAGSGLKLDPPQAREDLKPWSHMAGGIVDDTLSEIKPLQKLVDKLGDSPQASQPVVKVRCRHCGALDDEDARFCSACGQQM